VIAHRFVTRLAATMTDKGYDGRQARVAGTVRLRVNPYCELPTAWPSTAALLVIGCVVTLVARRR
jgi:hypothetical protein